MLTGPVTEHPISELRALHNLSEDLLISATTSI